LTENLKNSIFYYRALNLRGYEMPANCDAIVKLKNLSSSKEKDCARCLLDYIEAKAESSDASLCQSGIKPELIPTLSGIQDKPVWEEVVRDKAEEELEEAVNPESKLPHKKRRQMIMNAITRLLRLYEDRKAKGEDLMPETLTLLARAYLRRSRMIYPKGITIPARKREAIEKGLEFARKAIEKGGGEDAYRCMAMLYVEKERILGEDEKTDKVMNEIKSGLKRAIMNGCTRFNALEEDVEIATLYSECSGDTTSYLDQIISSSVSGVQLLKARAYRLKGCEDKLKKEMESFIDVLKNRYFSDPLWDDTVRFLIQLYRDCKDSGKFSCWKELSRKVWETCRDIEKKMLNPFHIRWYWARMRDLYDLAFLRVKDKNNDERCRKRVEIAESLKSRSTIRLNVISTLAEGDELIEYFFDEYAKASLGGYSIRFDEINEKIQKYQVKFKLEEAFREFKEEDVPANWTVIHFYLNHLENKGYALIYDKSNGWSEETFEFDKLFHAYMTWQTDYNRNKIDSADSLQKLCIEIGRAMPFLFNLPEGRNVLFIPHDFLHRLPLHGAIETDTNGNVKTVFLKKHPSCYLPAWGVMKENQSSPNSRNYLIVGSNVTINFDRTDFQEIEDFNGISDTPRLLAIACHGKADMVNPFNTSLKFRPCHKIGGTLFTHSVVREIMSIVTTGRCSPLIVLSNSANLSGCKA